MKNILMMFAMIGIVSCAATTTTNSSSVKSNINAGFDKKVTVSPDLLKKMDARGRLALESMKPSDGVELLIRTQTKPTPGQITAIQSTGFKAYFGFDIITSGTTTAGALNDLAALPYIAEIQMSVPLYPEE